MAEDGIAREHKEKPPIDDPELGSVENELDDSKAKFINGGNDTVVVKSPGSSASFSGLGKDELKRYADDPFWVRLRWILFILFWLGWLAMLVSAIVIIVLAPRCPTRPDLKWYHKDVSYNVYSKSFFDGDKDQDGYGDLDGILKKEDYISQLNANSIWLSSIFKTTGNDDRAVLDHKKLDEKFGTEDSLRSFCKKLLKAGKHVIVDLIPNQTSRNHTWFMKSQKKEAKYADYYVWSASDPGWTRADGSKMWVMDNVRGEYFLSQFEGTADLNLTNEDVMAEFKDIMQYLAGLGVNGFHINDLEYLTENATLASDDADYTQTRNYPANADVVQSLRQIIEGLDNKPGREKLLFGTMMNGDADHLKMYEGEEGKKGLHMVSVVLDDLTQSVSPPDLESELDAYVNKSAGYWLGWRLSSETPGSQRVFTRVGNNRMTVAHALQALLPGSSQPYYGDEIAMDTGATVGKETVSPMQWSKENEAGFTTGKPWLAVNQDYSDKNLDSMTAQLGDNAMMDSFKALNSLRESESLQFGATKFCSTDDFLIFSRDAPGFESFVVVVNFGQATAHRFQGDECVGDRKSAELVFTSHKKDHTDTVLNLNEAVSISANEVLVFKFPA